MENLPLLTATRILERTMPVMSRRFLIHAALAWGAIVLILAGASTFFGIFSFGNNPGFWAQLGAWAGVALSWYLLHRLRPTLLYPIRLLHLAAIVRRITDQELPPGKAQIEFLHQRLRPLFPTPQAIVTHFEKIQRVIVECFSTYSSPLSRFKQLPAPWGHQVNRWFSSLLLGFMADAILAFALAEEKRQASHKGAVTFIRHYRSLFRFSIGLNLFLLSAFLGVYWLMLKPVGWVDDAVPAEMGLWKYIFALILAGWLKASFLDPIVTTAATIKLFSLAKQMPPDLEKTEPIDQGIPSLAELLNG